ncbi:DNA polymerase lambda-like isoform X2 [Macrobrachium nipponense]|uniref:DNA polymerase lambda-like isoform X2 n=1 Tax=Macrobrachium nipponense TaxID=159736 RepID=UPI0030C83D25
MRRKISQPRTSQKKVKKEDSEQDCKDPVLATTFQGLIFHIHPASFGTGRLQIFEKQVKRYGGQLIQPRPKFSETVTHIIFEESIDSEKAQKLLDPVNFPKAVFVKCSWLSLCIKTKSKVSTRDFEINVRSDEVRKSQYKSETDSLCKPSTNVEGVAHTEKASVQPNESLDVSRYNEGDTSEATSQTHKVNDKEKQRKDELLSTQNQDNLVHSNENLEKDNKIKLSEDLVNNGENYPLIKPFPKNLQQKFVCSQPSSSQTKGFNSHITTELEKLAAAYKSKNDTWRAVGYEKAISAIRNYPHEITSREEALQIRGVGARLADKVAEIIESGKLRKVAEVCEGEEAQTLQLFMGVWGAGPTTAQSWYIQGFRTLDDLRSKATLTRHQQIGLKYYDDINSRIPRDEVVEIENYVRDAALSIKKGLIVTVCGSYRRGKPTCGDVDVLITHPDGHSHSMIFKPILQKLRDTGFLTDDLVIQEDNGDQKKYLGVCLLPGENRKHRRLDVIVVPYSEHAPALMYFTGSAHFNRSMRLLAIKMGLSLSEHGLRAGIVRQVCKACCSFDLLSPFL